jgi:hypothetical protein
MINLVFEISCEFVLTRGSGETAGLLAPVQPFSALVAIHILPLDPISSLYRIFLFIFLSHFGTQNDH